MMVEARIAVRGWRLGAPYELTVGEAMRLLDTRRDSPYDESKMVEAKVNVNSRCVSGSFGSYWYFYFGVGFPVLT